MQTGEALRRQLETVEDLRSIVATMKALATVSIRQYEEAVVSLAEYARSVELGLQILLRARPDALGEIAHAPARKLGAIVLGSDQGLCGAFNEQIAAFYLERRDIDAEAGIGHGPLLAVGARVAGRLEEASVPRLEMLTLPASVTLVASLAQELLVRVDRWHSAAEVEGVRVYFNRLRAGATYQAHVETLLPLDGQRLRQLALAPWRPRALPTFAGDWDAAFSAVVGEHLFVTLYRALAQSLESEHASRRAAMHAAQRNIDERLAALRSEFQRQRQSAITTELLDILSGYEALAAPVSSRHCR